MFSAQHFSCLRPTFWDQHPHLDTKNIRNEIPVTLTSCVAAFSATTSIPSPAKPPPSSQSRRRQRLNLTGCWRLAARVNTEALNAPTAGVVTSSARERCHTGSGTSLIGWLVCDRATLRPACPTGGGAHARKHAHSKKEVTGNRKVSQGLLGRTRARTHTHFALKCKCSMNCLYCNMGVVMAELSVV